MTTLAANEPRDIALEGAEMIGSRPVIASDIIFAGAAVGDNGSNLARPLVGGDVFFGFASRKADNASGSASDINVELAVKGTIVLNVVGVTGVTDTEAAVYATDDNLFTLTASGATQIGKVKRWESGTRCLVYFEAVSVRSV